MVCSQESTLLPPCGRTNVESEQVIPSERAPPAPRNTQTQTPNTADTYKVVPDICLPMIAPGKGLDEMILLEHRKEVFGESEAELGNILEGASRRLL